MACRDSGKRHEFQDEPKKEIRETLKIIEGRREVKTKEKALRAELRRKEK